MKLSAVLCLLSVCPCDLFSASLKLSPIKVEVNDATAVLYGENLSDVSGVTLNAASRVFSFAKEKDQETLSIILLTNDATSEGQTATVAVTNPSGVVSTTLTVYKKTGTVLTLSTFTQVQIKSNGKNVGTGVGPYQCVELIKRYYAELDPARFGTGAQFSTAMWSGSNGLAKDYYNDDSTGKGLSKIPNDGTLLKPGDVVVFDGIPKHKSGHVAVIDSEVTADSKDVEIVEQNWTSSEFGRAKLVFNSNHRLQNRGDWPILGFLRSAVPVNFKPVGSFDDIDLTAGKAFGWAKDIDNLSVPVQVHIYIDKNAGAAGASAIPVTASDPRSDVGNHAFNYFLPSSYKDGQTHTMWVWAIDLTDSTGAHNVQLGGSKMFNIASLNQPPSAGFVLTSGTHAISSFPPAATLQTLNLTVPPGGIATVTFDGSVPHSFDPDGSVASWSWSINNSFATTSPVFNRALSAGIYNVALVVTDNLGSTSTAAIGTVSVTELSTHSFTLTGSMKEARWQHTATLLNNGTVLVAGGASNTAEIYDPSSGTWRYTVHPMNFARNAPTAVKMTDGRVLIAGGTSSPSAAEIFDPVSEQFTLTNAMNAIHGLSPGLLLNDGRVLIITGSLWFFGVGVSEIYDPSTNSWTATPSIPVGVSQMAGARLSDGTALAIGGYDGYTRSAYPYVERYNPVGNSVAPMASMVVSRLAHTVTLLPSGQILIAAGSDASFSVSSTEIYDPTVLPNGQSQLSTSLNQTRRAHTATLLLNGDVLVTGGFQAPHGGVVSAYLNTAELRDHITGTWSLLVNSMSTARQAHTATLLPSGAVLVTGGGTTSPIATAEIWQ